MLTDLRLKFNNFIKRNKWKVILFIIAWAVLIAASTILANLKSDTPITTYEPFQPIIDNGQTMPSKWQDTIENTIDQYISYCNNKEYEKAYEMISEGCREKVYPELDAFKAYVDYVFNVKRIYTIQNYSNRDKTYIYRIRIFEDIMATGLTYSESFKYFEEKLVFTENNGKIQMAVKGYIGDETLDAVYEDQYMKVSIINKSMSYDEETYTVQIQNKTEHTIVISDDINGTEIQLETKNGTLNRSDDGLFNPIYLYAHESGRHIISFAKFYDEGIKTTGLKLNNIRILRSYSGLESMREQELSNAVELYSITIPLK